MIVFISHSLEDKGQFEDIAAALKQEGISYWDPERIKPGAFLSEQLNEAIGGSEVCIFVATHNSVKSAWCGAELGAFWGAGKPVIIYVADSSLSHDNLPHQFQGQFLATNISKAVTAAQQYLAEAEATTTIDDCEITIESPGWNASVPYEFEVRGSHKNLPDNFELWVFTTAGHRTDVRYWPQEAASVHPNGTWLSKVFGIGGKVGDRRTFGAFLVGKDGQALVYYWKTAGREYKKQGVKKRIPITKLTQDIVECVIVEVVLAKAKQN